MIEIKNELRLVKKEKEANQEKLKDLVKNIVELFHEIKCTKKNIPAVSRICNLLGMSPITMNKLINNKKVNNLEKYLIK